MSYLRLTVEQVIAVHDEVLEPNELQGMAGDKSLERALTKVENRLNYGLIENIYSLAACYAAAIAQPLSVVLWPPRRSPMSRSSGQFWVHLTSW